jgi:membrane fusion protein (multidrug efflux system)
MRSGSLASTALACVLALFAGAGAQAQTAARPEARKPESPPAPVVQTGEVRAEAARPGIPGLVLPQIPDSQKAGANEISVLIVPEEEATLSSQMPGRIKRVTVGLGDGFPKGAILIEFDCSEQEAQLQAAQAEYLGARETHLAKLRLQALGAAGELEVTLAASAAEKAKSQITLRDAQLDYCKVVAPYGGRVAKMKVKASESVSLGQPLLDIVNPASLKAQLYVPASWAAGLKVGARFQVRAGENGRRFTARVTKLNSRVEGVSQSFEVEGRFEGSTAGLLPGMVGTAVFAGRSDRP